LWGVRGPNTFEKFVHNYEVVNLQNKGKRPLGREDKIDPRGVKEGCQ